MAFSRVKYDDCAFKLQVNRETGPGNYRLFSGSVENCDQCFSASGPVGSKADVSTTKNSCSLDWTGMAQVESDLTWRGNQLTKCNENAANTNWNKNAVNNKPLCNPTLNSEDTRFTFPIQAYRSMSLLDYQLEPFLFSNPQCHVQDDRQGMDSRNTVKDSYRVPKQDFIDKGESLPTEIKTNSTCSNI
jgi:hypothetical protein